MSIVILMGPPGAGKGTVSEGMVNTGFTHVSTGDLLREQIQLGTPLGMAAAKIEKGQFASDDIVIGMVKEFLANFHEDEKILFDGFPRTIVQAEQLDVMIDELGRELSDVILLECSDDVIINRISGRRTCKICSSVYNVNFMPADVCEKDGGELLQRPDDEEEIVQQRMEIYNEMTYPLIEYYDDKNVMRHVDANQNIEVVQDHVLSILR